MNIFMLENKKSLKNYNRMFKLLKFKLYTYPKKKSFKKKFKTKF